jgi:hypothetical protein
MYITLRYIAISSSFYLGFKIVAPRPKLLKYNGALETAEQLGYNSPIRILLDS